MKLDELDLEKIKQIRLNKKIAIEELSLALGYKTRYGYQHVEKGRRKLPAFKMPTLSRLLGTPIDDLYKKNSNLAGMDKSVKYCDGSLESVPNAREERTKCENL